MSFSQRASANIVSAILAFYLFSPQTPLFVDTMSIHFLLIYTQFTAWQILTPLPENAKMSECQLESQIQENGLSMI